MTITNCLSFCFAFARDTVPLSTLSTFTSPSFLSFWNIVLKSALYTNNDPQPLHTSCQSVNCKYRYLKRRRARQRIFDTLICLPPSSRGPLLTFSVIRWGHRTVLYVVRLVIWGQTSFQTWCLFPVRCGAICERSTSVCEFLPRSASADHLPIGHQAGAWAGYDRAWWRSPHHAICGYR